MRHEDSFRDGRIEYYVGPRTMLGQDIACRNKVWPMTGFVFYCCCNIYHKLQTIQICYLTFLEIRSPKWVLVAYWVKIWFLLEALKGDHVSLTFSACRGHLHRLACDAFLISFQTLASISTSPTTNLGSSAFFSHKKRTLVDYIRPIQGIQDNLSISRPFI